VKKALIRFIPAAAAALAVAAIAASAATSSAGEHGAGGGALTKIGSVVVPGGAGGEGIAAA
jgi:hypothetical protein